MCLRPRGIQVRGWGFRFKQIVEASKRIKCLFIWRGIQGVRISKYMAGGQ